MAYVVVGNPKGLPAVVGDIDLVVEADVFHRLLRDRDLWFGERWMLVQAMRHEASAVTFVLTPRHASDPASPPELLLIDVCSDYVRDARFLMSASSLLAARRRYTPPAGGVDIWVPPPESAFTYYLVKKVAKGQVDEDAFSYLMDTLAEAPEPPITAFFGAPASSAALEAVGRADIEALRLLLPQLRRELYSRTPRRPRDVLRHVRHVVGRLRWPAGLLVEVFGGDPDAARVVADGLADDLRRAFRRTSVASHSASSGFSPMQLWGLLLRTGLVIHIGRQYGSGHRLRALLPPHLRTSIWLRDADVIDVAIRRASRLVIDHLAARASDRLG